MKARDEQRDRELDLAWRAANRDEPPAAVDAAIKDGRLHAIQIKTESKG